MNTENSVSLCWIDRTSLINAPLCSIIATIRKPKLRISLPKNRIYIKTKHACIKSSLCVFFYKTWNFDTRNEVEEYCSWESYERGDFCQEFRHFVQYNSPILPRTIVTIVPRIQGNLHVRSNRLRPSFIAGEREPFGLQTWIGFGGSVGYGAVIIHVCCMWKRCCCHRS